MAQTPRFPVPPTRRSVVAAAGGVGLAAALAACGSSDDSSDSASSDTSSPSAAPTTSDAGAAPTTSAAAGGTALGKTSDIPVGGGKIYTDAKVVVTQPTAGQYKAFSAICTHQQCVVSAISDGTINCTCHGSKFNVADGAVAHGPATAPLPPKNVTVSGDEVTLTT